LRYSQLAKEIIPTGVPYNIIPANLLVENKRLPTASVWVEGIGDYKAGLVIPDIEVSESISIINRVVSDPVAILVIEDLLREEKVIRVDEEMTAYDFARFSIYHELGHWYDFQNRYLSKGLTGKQFNADNKTEMSNLKLDEIALKVRNEINGSTTQVALLKLYHRKYRENIFEVIADRFAIESMI
jgi:hypothetical protein